MMASEYWQQVEAELDAIQARWDATPAPPARVHWTRLAGRDYPVFWNEDGTPSRADMRENASRDAGWRRFEAEGRDD